MEGVIALGVVMLVVFIILVLYWARSKITLDDRNCRRILAKNSTFPLLRNISPENPKSQFKLRDYYIKTAYNCCASGNYKNDYVNICALTNCIKQGARCLDFEIYSVHNKPAIAVSSKNEYYMKETFNTVPFGDAMQAIWDTAFSSSGCNNPADPLLLHFRIMSQNKETYNQMAKILTNVLETKLLDKSYSYEYNGHSIGDVPLLNFSGKVIIIVDKSLANGIFVDTDLYELVNLASNSEWMRILRLNDVTYTPDMNELINFNKQRMSICMPDLATNARNISAILPMNYGCQMVAMVFQKKDSKLIYYNKLFDEAGSAFILKPEKLRYIPVPIEVPNPPHPSVSYASRTLSLEEDLGLPNKFRT